MRGAAHQYAEQIRSGEIDSCEPVQLAVARYFADLEREDLHFNELKAKKYIEFFRRTLRHTIGHFAGMPFDPLPWQKFVLWNLYGWEHPDGRRRFNYAYLSMGRKQGKTTMMAGCVLAALVMDGEPAAEIYSAATKRDQARIVFDEARRMVMASPALKKYIQVGRHHLTTKTHGRFTYLSSDAHTLDGTNPHLAIIDEYHGHPTDEVSNVIRSGMQSRRNPLHLTITTAGISTNSPCHKMHRTCMDILRGIKSDEAQFAIMYQIDEKDEKHWTKPAQWIKANPSLGHTITLEALQKQMRQALNMGGTRETEFKTKHLNIWTTSAKTWIPDRYWKKCFGEDLPAGKCFGGLDLASVSDLTALVLIWPENDRCVVRGWYWLPRETYENVLASDPGHFYADLGTLPNVFLTDGNVTDYASIRRFVTGHYITDEGIQYDNENLLANFQVSKIAFDRHNSTQIAIDLTDDGAPLAPYGQGFVSMSPGAKEAEILIRSGKMSHDGDPVLRWALQNVELRVDPAGNIKPDKAKSRAKIDPVVSLCMALGESLRAEPGIDPAALRVLSL